MSKRKALEEKYSVGIPSNISDFWKNFEKALKLKVFGQEHAVAKITERIMILEAGLFDLDKAPDPLFFAGLPGTGKTFLAKMAAQLWLGISSEELEKELRKIEEKGISPFIIIAGENYQARHESASLKGAPPGYVGYKQKTPFKNMGLFDKEARKLEFVQIFKDWYEKLVKSHSILDKDRDVLNKILQDKITKMHKKYRSKYMERFKPFRTVLLVDDVEKMHINVQKQFLGILNEGKFILSNGKVVNFSRCLIIFTSNLGTVESSKLLLGEDVGFSPGQEIVVDDILNEQIDKTVRRQVKKHLVPELYSRIGDDSVVVFHQLSKEDYRKIIEAEIGKIRKQIIQKDESENGLYIETTLEFREFILGQAKINTEGARQIGRLLSKHLRSLLANAIDAGRIHKGDSILVVYEDGKVALKRKKRSKKIKNSEYKPRRILTKEDEDAITLDLNESGLKQIRKALPPSKESL